MLKSADRLLFAIAAVFIAAYFLFLTHASLDAYFTPDDMMNLYRSWSPPIGELIRSNLLFIFSSTFMRPMGSVWYRTLYDFAGFNPAPFHFANLLILLANIFLTYCVSRRLTGSRLTGALAALLNCYHPGLAWLYFDTGYVYDVLCYFFYFAALLCYLRIRQEGRVPGFWGFAGLIALYVCALNSKEMALTLPVTLFIYELVYHSPRSPRWLLQEGRATLVLGLLTVAFLIGHARGSASLLQNARYQPVFTWQRFMETGGHFFNSLFDQDGSLAPVPMLFVWAMLFAIAWITHSKTLKFSWLFLMLSVAPIAFVPPRGMPQYYIPWFGWTLYLAVALVSAIEYLLPRLPGPVRAAALVAVVAAILFPLYRGIGFGQVTTVTLEAPEVRSIVNQLHRLRPSFPPRARILFLNDPAPANAYDLLFMVSVQLWRQYVCRPRQNHDSTAGCGGAIRVRHRIRLPGQAFCRCHPTSTTAGHPARFHGVLPRRLESRHRCPSRQARRTHHRQGRGSWPNPSGGACGSTVSIAALFRSSAFPGRCAG